MYLQRSQTLYLKGDYIMCKIEDLTPEQRKLVNEIMERENRQRKVDEIVAKVFSEQAAKAG